MSDRNLPHLRAKEAIHKLRGLIDCRLEAEAEAHELEIGGQSHRLASFAGIFKEDPSLQQWKDAMAEYRQRQ